jgi:L-iditol 2-dehydrogenase
MKKAYLAAIRKIELRNVADPKVSAPDDVLVGLKAIGVCGSDLHYYRDGRIGEQVVTFPFSVGHECAGTILQAGPASGRKVGQRVAIDPLVACGQCDQCLAGRENTCRSQKFLGCPGQLEGSTAELLVMPGRCALPIPDTMTFEQAVMSEPFAIGMWAAHLAGPTKGKKIAVLGCGPIGLCVIQALKAAGECTIFATDLLDSRVELARRTGAAWSGNAAKIDPVAEILKQAPNGVDVVVECVGLQDTIDQAGQLLTPGGKLVIVGIPPQHRLSMDMNFFRRRELSVQNVRRQNGCAQKALDLIASGKVSLDPQITHHFSLDQTQAAFDLVADYRDGVVKAMINP